MLILSIEVKFWGAILVTTKVSCPWNVLHRLHWVGHKLWGVTLVDTVLSANIFFRPNSLSKNTSKVFSTNVFGNCNTDCAIYLAACSCSAFYVGQTSIPFKFRISEHLCNIRNKHLPNALYKYTISHKTVTFKCIIIVRLWDIDP